MLEELKSTDVECLRKIACRLQIKLILLSKFFSKSVWFISPESGFNHVSTNVSISRENEKTKFCNQVLLVTSGGSYGGAAELQHPQEFEKKIKNRK